MDVSDGRGGYPAMRPLVDPPVEVGAVGPGPDHLAGEPGPDYLLLVATPHDARAALDAGERLVLPDGRGTAWLAADRLVTGAWYVVLLATALGQDTAGGDFPSARLLVLLALGVPVLLLDLACSRAVGLRPRQVRASWWARGAQGLAAGVAVFVLVNLGSSSVTWRGPVLAVGVLLYSSAPVVGWWRASHRGGGAPVEWPPGSQAFALLSVLARVEGVTADRLLTLNGLPPVNGDRWLDRLRSEQALYGGRRRHWVVGDTLVGLTAPGRERLDRMRADLERLAARVPVG
jgi:hypothetical protein